MEHKTLVDAVVTAEWEMFSNVQNVGGKASCQMDPKTFRIMRSSQMDNWDDKLLGSYLEDLLNARLEGRNLVTEKYARMMESTFPEEYAQLADSLPPLDPEAMAQVDDIVAAHVAWKEDLDSRFPSLADRGRPLRSRDDRPGWVSMETYLRAELRTYSPKTIALYHRATMERLRKGESEAEQNLLHQVQQYGFEDIESAEKHFRDRHKAGCRKNEKGCFRRSIPFLSFRGKNGRRLSVGSLEHFFHHGKAGRVPGIHAAQTAHSQHQQGNGHAHFSFAVMDDAGLVLHLQTVSPAAVFFRPGAHDVVDLVLVLRHIQLLAAQHAMLLVIPGALGKKAPTKTHVLAIIVLEADIFQRILHGTLPLSCSVTAAPATKQQGQHDTG